MQDTRAASPRSSPLRIGVAGATLETGNLGVSALTLSILTGLIAAENDVEVTLIDRSPGSGSLARVPGVDRPIGRLGCYLSRRFHSPSNLQQCFGMAHAGLGGVHPTLRSLRRLDAVLDVSGGDSFSDLYGERRFRAQTWLKRTVLRLGVPLVLMPQTYGPFSREECRRVAQTILRRSTLAWARDPNGVEALADLLGPDFDKTRHRGSVDVAFGLSSEPPSDPELRGALTRIRERSSLLLGLNVSGLLHLDERVSTRDFGFRTPYPDLIRRLVRELLRIDDAHVLLVSHVQPSGYAEGGDHDAAQEIRRSLAPTDAERVFVAPFVDDPRQTKWIIGLCDWFCGTRMHSCIAGLSQGVPTTAIAYSPKTVGVFETMRSGEWVFDPRELDASDVIDGLRSTIDRRGEQGALLSAALPGVKKEVAAQFESTLGVVRRGTS